MDTKSILIIQTFIVFIIIILTITNLHLYFIRCWFSPFKENTKSNVIIIGCKFPIQAAAALICWYTNCYNVTVANLSTNNGFFLNEIFKIRFQKRTTYTFYIP